MKTLTNTIKKAIIEMLILKLLLETDMYGYQVTQEFKKRSNSQFTVPEGSMYPILYRLTDAGCISSYEKKVGVRQTRVYYHIEKSGIEQLEAMQIEFYQAIQIAEFLLQSENGACYEQDN